MRAEDTRALGLAVFIGTAGAMHFVRPHFFDAIVPDWMPGTKRQVTLVSGGVELASAVLVAIPSTRRVGALACLLTFIGVYPANIQSALDGGVEGTAPPFDTAAVAWLRLPLQIPMFLWARRVLRDAARA